MLEKFQELTWDNALLLGDLLNSKKNSIDDANKIANQITKIREEMGKKSRNSKAPTTVVFGTSGWRDRIGEGFTVLNVAKVVRGIIEVLKTSEYQNENNYTSFDEVRKAGILLLRDNRYLGEEFIETAKRELVKEHIRIFDANECPTGVGSALATTLGVAGSINFTPSHNPMDYQGLKFNPRDGGPADLSITKIIEEKSNSLMKETTFEMAKPSYETIEELTTHVDSKKLFTEYVEKRTEIIDLRKIRNFVKENANNLFIGVDYMHGSARGFIETLLGKELMTNLEKTGSVAFYNTNNDYSFHGAKPEPNEKNQKVVIEKLKESRRPLTLGCALDPDADRIRFCDASLDLEMNSFGPIAYWHLLSKGLTGAVISTAPSTDFAFAIARKHNQESEETAVGFKYFRPYLATNRALVAFEESDGFSMRGHTLEKDGIIAFLMALDIMATHTKNLSEIYKILQEQYGYFYPKKAGIDVKGITVDEWVSYKKRVTAVLTKDLFTVGSKLDVGGTSKTVKSINTIDGLKVVFEDLSWILLRPSGTEPKFRIYYELASPKAISNIEELSTAYLKAGEKILELARSKV